MQRDDNNDDGDTQSKLKEALAANCPHKIKDCAAALEYAMCFRNQYLKLHPQPKVST
ncbi:hypothetical protein MSG28_009013 [Choristoneura fumiferana]|uniref:Uncharacterized protein n=1 Tax=Choristoneura fumiferana TaxID=7141 RepID=A0ACC0J8T4_CHOFU|nr:hypothetical protein MSG28_009013 [Choristoneura fumiferana]